MRCLAWLRCFGRMRLSASPAAEVFDRKSTYAEDRLADTAVPQRLAVGSARLCSIKARSARIGGRSRFRPHSAEEREAEGATWAGILKPDIVGAVETVCLAHPEVSAVLSRRPLF